MGVDGLLGVDRFVAHRGGDIAMADDELGYVGWHAVQDGVGDENPPEVMRSEVQRTAAGVGEPAVGEGPGQERADGWAADRAVFAGVAALEQQRGGRVPDPLVVVVGDDERHCTVVVGDATDDHVQHVREFRAYNEEALGVGFRRHDVEQRDHLAAGGHGVLDEACLLYTSRCV